MARWWTDPIESAHGLLFRTYLQAAADFYSGRFE